MKVTALTWSQVRKSISLLLSDEIYGRFKKAKLDKVQFQTYEEEIATKQFKTELGLTWPHSYSSSIHSRNWGGGSELALAVSYLTWPVKWLTLF